MAFPVPGQVARGEAPGHSTNMRMAMRQCGRARRRRPPPQVEEAGEAEREGSVSRLCVASFPSLLRASPCGQAVWKFQPPTNLFYWLV